MDHLQCLKLEINSEGNGEVRFILDNFMYVHCVSWSYSTQIKTMFFILCFILGYMWSELYLCHPGQWHSVGLWGRKLWQIRARKFRWPSCTDCYFSPARWGYLDFKMVRNCDLTMCIYWNSCQLGEPVGFAYVWILVRERIQPKFPHLKLFHK